MKNIKNIFYVGMLALCTMSFTACSDEETYDFPGDPYNHVYLQDKGGTFTFVHTPISSISTLDLTLPLYCNHRVTSNFIAKVEVDNSLVAAYNEENNTEYDVGDIVGARETITGVTIKRDIVKKILKVNSSGINVECQIGE